MSKPKYAPSEIKEIRHRLSMTQAEFARKLMVDSVTISRWERGVHAPDKRSEWMITRVMETELKKKGERKR